MPGWVIGRQQLLCERYYADELASSSIPVSSTGIVIDNYSPQCLWQRSGSITASTRGPASWQPKMFRRCISPCLIFNSPFLSNQQQSRMSQFAPFTTREVIRTSIILHSASRKHRSPQEKCSTTIVHSWIWGSDTLLLPGICSKLAIEFTKLNCRPGQSYLTKRYITTMSSHVAFEVQQRLRYLTRQGTRYSRANNNTHSLNPKP